MERIPARYLARQWAIQSQLWSSQSSALAGRQHDLIATRHLSQRTPANDQPKGIFARILENIRSEWKQNTDIKESLEKFRAETRKLEETEALKQAREKYKKVEAESTKDVSEVLQSAKDSLKSGVEKAKEAEFVRRTMQFGDKISNRAKDAAEGISKQGEYIKESTAYKKMSEASKTVGKELDEAEVLSTLYQPPRELLKRSERSLLQGLDSRPVEPNAEAQSVELHKDSKWSQNWKKFKEENPYMNTVFELKMKYDESDNPLVRITRNLVDRISDTIGGLFQTTDISNVLTEICKVDPNFSIESFLKDCEKFVIPTILEAMIQEREDILSDWCYEAVFNVLTQQHKEAKKLGWKIHSQILDLQNVELAMAKMMDQGPVLVVTFNAHQLTYATDSKGQVMEGNPDKVVLNTYVMAFCRDQDDLDPNTAWRLIDVAMQQSQIMI